MIRKLSLVGLILLASIIPVYGAGDWTYYGGSTIVTVDGVVDAGWINSTWTRDDGNYYNVSEVGGVPGMHIRLNFTNVDESATCLWLATWSYYDGTAVHDFDIRIWNFTAAAWVDIGLIEDGVDFSWVNATIYDLRIPTDFIDSERVWACYYHSSAGNPAHDVSIDYVSLVAELPSTTTTTSDEVDIPLLILAAIAIVFTLLMFFAEEAYLAAIFAIIGMVSNFACAGYWLSSQTNIPGIAWLFGGLGLVDLVFLVAEVVMTAYPSVRRRAFGEDPI